MDFLLDENVPLSVSQVLEKAGHTVRLLVDHAPAGSPDPVVATVSEQLESVLVTFDGDFEKVAPRIAKGHRTRFRRLSRIWLRCREPQAARRIAVALSLIETEFDHAQKMKGGRMVIGLSDSYIRTQR